MTLLPFFPVKRVDSDPKRANGIREVNVQWNICWTNKERGGYRATPFSMSILSFVRL